jgi:hypothetical protein
MMLMQVRADLITDQLSILDGNCHARADESGLDMRLDQISHVVTNCLVEKTNRHVIRAFGTET